MTVTYCDYCDKPIDDQSVKIAVKRNREAGQAYSAVDDFDKELDSCHKCAEKIRNPEKRNMAAT